MVLRFFKMILINQCVLISTAFSLWTITSFLCHHIAKEFLIQSGPTLTGVCIISFCQLLFCVSCLEITAEDNHESIHQKGNLKHFKLICGVSHVVATLSTNYSMSLIRASSTFAIKMLEPVTSALVQWVVFAVTPSVSTVLSLPIIVTGAVIFTGNPFQDAILSRGLIWALVSNLALAFRNIAMKKLFDVKMQIVPRSVQSILSVNAVALVGLVILAKTPNGLDVAPLYILSLISAIFHVLYSYLSVALVLKTLSVVTHALLNIFKRVCVVVLLCIAGKGVLNIENISGLLLSFIGLIIYTLQKTQLHMSTIIGGVREPDMAFEIGSVERFVSPTFDILWMRRSDDESTKYQMPYIPHQLSYHVADWLSWPTPKSPAMEYAFHIATNGMLFLQRGRVVITDRLHGHILSTLLGIPHVILDNNYHKVSSYHLNSAGL
ncbi:glucose-6-phosphate/phosphate translocator 2, chloroplastic-like [Haliotis rufescens]|uniref:glucose-6-phosphate/phosphate translocator 2, chloroplastic-like n=1 Tax=Haliotis rufescens TaxID=6454 RepID=UPI00201EA2BF|nr:glucose-6-phosphate/phosphate translocator 2, chloroplastic-like [Haliotis rufescens]